MLRENRSPGVLTPDYIWNNALWELKTVASEKAADSAVRHGVKQIADNPGGIILQFDAVLNAEKLKKVVADRLSRSKIECLDIIFLNGDKLVGIFRYKK